MSFLPTSESVNSNWTNSEASSTGQVKGHVGSWRSHLLGEIKRQVPELYGLSGLSTDDMTARVKSLRKDVRFLCDPDTGLVWGHPIFVDIIYGYCVDRERARAVKENDTAKLLAAVEGTLMCLIATMIDWCLMRLLEEPRRKFQPHTAMGEIVPSTVRAVLIPSRYLYEVRRCERTKGLLGAVRLQYPTENP
jgi:hypothetical protein